MKESDCVLLDDQSPYVTVCVLYCFFWFKVLNACAAEGMDYLIIECNVDAYYKLHTCYSW